MSIEKSNQLLYILCKYDICGFCAGQKKHARAKIWSHDFSAYGKPTNITFTQKRYIFMSLFDEHLCLFIAILMNLHKSQQFSVVSYCNFCLK